MNTQKARLLAAHQQDRPMNVSAIAIHPLNFRMHLRTKRSIGRLSRGNGPPPPTVFQAANGEFGVMPTADYDGDPAAIIHEFDPFQP